MDRVDESEGSKAIALKAIRGVFHGRYVGWAPEPMVAVDIFRVDNGRLVFNCEVDLVVHSKTA
jgi:hypothetical protein